MLVKALIFALLLFPSLPGLVLAADVEKAGPEKIDYNRVIRPILADKCFNCHGPDAGGRQAELRLDTAEGAYAALESDDALHGIVPGNADKSTVFQRIISTDKFEVMPPADSNLKLTSEEIASIRKWIEQGAEYQQHWAFLSPKKTPVPMMEGGKWGRNFIDAFVLQKMRQQGLEPNPSATREQLIRRVSFDLTGLPPTLEELDSFLADTSPDAYEKVVDRLLASERFGERMAAEWLDVARYSDTYGFQVDRGRFVWPWRDWVIQAFNRDLPYDQFILQQLAGDMLPEATQQEILATTFCRLHPQEAEGGSVPEEYRVTYVADRIQTVATSMLGLTLECCRCHDHKYDPLSQKEYFQLFAYFDDIDEAGLYSFFTASTPTPALLLTDDATQKNLDSRQAEIIKLEQQLTELLKQAPKPVSVSIDDQKAQKTSTPDIIPGQVLHHDFETVKAPSKNIAGVVGQAAQLTGDDPINTEVGNFHRYEPFSLSLWIQTPDVKQRAVILHRSRAWTDAGSRGYELLIDEGKLSVALIHFDPGNSLRIRTKEKGSLNQWHHVGITYDGSSRAAGLRLFINGQPVEVDVIRDHLTKEITGGGGDSITIGERFRDSGFKNGLIDELRVFNRELTPLEVSLLHAYPAGPDSLPKNWRETVQPEQLRHYDRVTRDANWIAAVDTLKEARKAESEIIEKIPEIMVMREMDEPRQAFILNRGEYNLRGEEVFAGTPEVFPGLPDGVPNNRLGFAQWLISPEHPLTARVSVNRYWQLIFGMGLVSTSEDFGNQGEWPSHPELFDTLSQEWIEQGWSLKWLVRQMVLSETYRQSTSVSAEKEAIDPGNRWLSRMYSDRLSAEMLRDNSLMVSGLLVNRIGGPPVKPYELEVAFAKMPRDKGEGLYRRSLYTYWSRTGPAPVMMTLDAAKRDVCQVKRDRTLSPLQPLVMLNGPQFVEAARLLGERVMKDHPDNIDAALVDMFRWTTSRHPTGEEQAILKRLYEAQLIGFQEKPDDAVAFLSVGDKPRDESLNPPSLAAFAGVANMLFNFDECVFRR